MQEYFPTQGQQLSLILKKVCNFFSISGAHVSLACSYKASLSLTNLGLTGKVPPGLLWELHKDMKETGLVPVVMKWVWDELT